MSRLALQAWCLLLLLNSHVLDIHAVAPVPAAARTEAAQTAAAVITPSPAVSIISLAAGRATQYTWTVETATYPSGLSIRVGARNGNLVISSNFTRTAAGRVGVVSGAIRVDNPGQGSLWLTAVQVLVQQPTAEQMPVRGIAECPQNQEGIVVVAARQAITCPFAVQLPGSSSAAVAVQGQAFVLGGGQVASPASMAAFSNAATYTSSGTEGSTAAAGALDLGKCAMVSDSFASGQLYLAPGAVAAGSSMPALGGALAVCGTVRSLYRVAFGPYVNDGACGTYKVMRTARVNPLGGQQPPATAASLVLVSVTDCSSPTPPAPLLPPPPAGPVPLPAPSSSMPPTTQSVIFGPPAVPRPVYVPVPTAAPLAAQHYAPVASAPLAPTPAAPTPAPAGGEYYYTYEYEATVPASSRRRRGRRRLQEQQQQQLSNSSKLGAGESSSVRSTSTTEHSAVSGSSNSDVEGSSTDAIEAPHGAGLGAGLAWLPQQEQRPSSQEQQQQNMLQAGRQESWPQTSIHRHHHQQQQDHGWAGLAGTQQLEAAFGQAGMDLQQLQQALQTGYGLTQGLPAADSSALHPAVVFSSVEPPGLHLQQEAAGGGWRDQQQQQQQEQQVEQHLLPADQGMQQYSSDISDHLLLVNADSREQRWQMRQMRRRLQQSTAALQPGAGAAYYSAAAAAADSSMPSVAFGHVKLDSTVLSFAWQPKVAVTPAALTLQVGSTATLQYSVQVLRTQLPHRVLLRGSVLLRNPLRVPVRLAEVAVEAPAAGQPAWGYSAATCSTPGSSSASGASIASILASSVTVPAKGQLACSFVLSYPAEAPAQGVVFARATTDAGRELVSAPFSFTRPAAAPAAAHAARLGACAMVSDTFMAATDSAAVLAPSKVPASGTKAPDTAAAALGIGSSKGGVLLCDSAAFAYTATLGPYTASQCGNYKVLSYVRVHPMNGSIIAPAHQSASATVDVTGCSPLGGIAAANLVSAAAVSATTSAHSSLGASGTTLALPTVTLQPLEIRQVTSYVWSVDSTPATPDVRLPHGQAFHAAFMVQYRRSAAPPGVTISGVLTVRNPNLLDAIWLAQAQVELSVPGGTGPSARAWASCPRDASGHATVSGQLLGSGSLHCSWSMELLAAGPHSDLISAGSMAQLVAVATTSTGREAASAAVPLGSVPAGAKGAKPAGACAALTSAFQMVGPGGEQLLLPSSALSSSNLLPGEAGGGRAADVVCNSLSLSYGATYGPLTDTQCGTYKTTNVATASPTTGQGDLAAAAAGMVLEFNGCPGAAATLNITALQLQMLKATYWDVTGQIAAGSSIAVSVGSTLDVAFGLRYTATAGPAARQMVGAVSIRNVGKAALQMSQLLLDVTPLEAGMAGQGALLTWGATCPGGSSYGGVSSIPANTSISCTFTGNVPASLTGAASVVARLQLVDGSEAASPAALADFSKAPTAVVTRGRCAIVADQFVSGAGLLQPTRTSRPAAAAAARQVCSSHSVSFVASLGPFTEAQCGQQLAVVNLARVSPVSSSAIQLPISVATVLGVNIAGGCGSTSSGTS
ncbi:hypothetical protein COO60DRAFT_467880 [Scenedesmus sp. NREL 46B-D3]|nr:hypothetical protein COO60DRAFT_467880 [Scenedesmus sp. NREL 46B-D3]